MAAADLNVAAGIALTRLLPRAQAGTMGADLLAFCNAFKAQFSEQRDLDHPFINWISVIDAISVKAGALHLAFNGGLAGGAIPSLTKMPYSIYQAAGAAVYRVCWLAYNLAFTGQITAGQANAILAAYNAHIY